MFLVTRPRSFSLKSKKKKEDWRQNKTKSCWFGIAIGDGGAGFACFTCSWLDVFTVIARKREKNLLLLRSMMEEDDRNNISNHSLFKKHDAFHSCTFAKTLSKFQRPLAIIKWQSLASDLRYLVDGHGNQKPLCLLLKSSNVDFAESNEVLLWQNQAVCLIWKLKHVPASHLVSELGKTNAFAMLIGWTELRTFFHRKERSFTKKSLTFVATGLTLSSVGNKKLKKRRKKNRNTPAHTG